MEARIQLIRLQPFRTGRYFSGYWGLVLFQESPRSRRSQSWLSILIWVLPAGPRRLSPSMPVDGQVLVCILVEEDNNKKKGQKLRLSHRNVSRKAWGHVEITFCNCHSSRAEFFYMLVPDTYMNMYSVNLQSLLFVYVHIICRWVSYVLH